MSRALITGGGNFIGSYLWEVLFERGWTVKAVDDLSTGSIENISHLNGHPRFAYRLEIVINRSPTALVAPAAPTTSSRSRRV